MTGKRKAETRDARTWDGDVAAANHLDEVRHWVVWGIGGIAERGAEDATEGETPAAEPGNDVAEAIARGRDPEWAGEEDWDRWVVIVQADEDDVDAWAQDDETVRGYAPYLLDRDATRADTDRMRGVLRSDRVRRRRFDTGRPD